MDTPTHKVEIHIAEKTECIICGKQVYADKPPYVCHQCWKDQKVTARIAQLQEALTFYAKRHHDANHISDKIEDCTSEVCKTYSDLMAGVPTSTMNEDAKFMANVWTQIRQHGYEFITEGGDPDGVDFVADRILGIQS